MIFQKLPMVLTGFYWWAVSHVALFTTVKRLKSVLISSISTAVFVDQGKAVGEKGADDAKILVVGNPANTNALIGDMQLIMLGNYGWQ